MASIMHELRIGTIFDNLVDPSILAWYLISNRYTTKMSIKKIIQKCRIIGPKINTKKSHFVVVMGRGICCNNDCQRYIVNRSINGVSNVKTKTRN
jgi:hypothetical protein